MTRLYTNNATGALLNAALTTDTTLTLQSGQGAKFPNPTTGNNFSLTLVGMSAGVEASWEIVSVTARATDVLTVVRAQEGTTAAAWGVGTIVELRFTAAAAQVSAGASGSYGNSVFFENDQTVTSSYTLTAGKNAMTAGPVSINTGVTVTIPDGARWTVVQ